MSCCGATATLFPRRGVDEESTRDRGIQPLEECPMSHRIDARFLEQCCREASEGLLSAAAARLVEALGWLAPWWLQPAVLERAVDHRPAYRQYTKKRPALPSNPGGCWPIFVRPPSLHVASARLRNPSAMEGRQRSRPTSTSCASNNWPIKFTTRSPPKVATVGGLAGTTTGRGRTRLIKAG